jgi:hypothetical protein
MQVVSAETDLDLAVVVDEDAEPADFDAAVAVFLLSIVDGFAGAPAAWQS